MTKRTTAEEKDRRRRLKWWHEARFGMFIHWGIYSVLGRHEWVMNRERIPVKEYEKLADRFRPKPNVARTWAKLAKEAGQKYMVMTTKHHDGFCLFNSELTDYCAPKRAAGRDFVAEYVEAARSEGMRVGFYYSLKDWHHPDGARCYQDEKARRRFVAYIHGHLRELCTNYGKVDVLWYDGAWPLDARGWESRKMNAMVRKLQPDILINNRSQVPEDFSTPEQRVMAEPEGRAWEACMTMNGSWGYNAGDDRWKSAPDCVEHLVMAARGGGNYLLNIGPRADGSVPALCVRVLRRIGDWLSRNGEAIYGSELSFLPLPTGYRLPAGRVHLERMMNVHGFWTVKGHTAYLHVFAWPGSEMTIGGMRSKVKSVRLLATGKRVRFEQEPNRLFLRGLPQKKPDQLATVIAVECAGKPRQQLGPGCVVL